MSKKILYVDMDGVLVDFQSGINKLDLKTKSKYEDRFDEVPNIFSIMDPIDGALDAFKKISKIYDTYILSTSPWNNRTALQDKQDWVIKYLGLYAEKRLMFSHHKNLNKGDYLIDDRNARGAKDFEGQHIWFGKSPFENWDKVLKYLCTEKSQ